MVFILNRSLEILKLYNPDREKLLVPPESYIFQFEKVITKTLETDKTYEIEDHLKIEDITQKKKAEEELCKARKTYRLNNYNDTKVSEVKPNRCY